jgi:hypothetical protein
MPVNPFCLTVERILPGEVLVTATGPVYEMFPAFSVVRDALYDAGHHDLSMVVIDHDWEPEVEPGVQEGWWAVQQAPLVLIPLQPQPTHDAGLADAV